MRDFKGKKREGGNRWLGHTQSQKRLFTTRLTVYVSVIYEIYFLSGEVSKWILFEEVHRARACRKCRPRDQQSQCRKYRFGDQRSQSRQAISVHGGTQTPPLGSPSGSTAIPPLPPLMPSLSELSRKRKVCLFNILPSKHCFHLLHYF